MKQWFCLALCLLLAACANVTPVVRADHLLADDQFGAATERIRADDVFALSDAMRAYADGEMKPLLRMRGMQQGLVDALYSKGQLQLEYDAAQTRNAAQAFEGRSGNCLSLVIMTAAFAKHFGMPVRYQSVLVEDSWSRDGDLYLASSHVNLSLAKRPVDARVGFDASHLLTIDFLPPEDVRGHRTREVSEPTVVAMFMNNRAVESMARGRLDDAYWWVREAVLHAPGYLRAFNTLAVIYQRHGDPQRAEWALQHVLAAEPGNVQALSNLVRALQAQGKAEQSAQAAMRLKALEPYPPYHFYHLGRAAIDAADFRGARELFTQEVKRAPYHHEFQFWLAVAHFGLGEFEAADRRMKLAMDYSPTRVLQGRYAEKLERLRSARLQ
jgi:Tfp pilus assembly protein PilF